jgi:hypothetical protein
MILTTITRTAAAHSARCGSCGSCVQSQPDILRELQPIPRLGTRSPNLSPHAIVGSRKVRGRVGWSMNGGSLNFGSREQDQPEVLRQNQAIPRSGHSRSKKDGSREQG